MWNRRKGIYVPPEIPHYRTPGGILVVGERPPEKSPEFVDQNPAPVTGGLPMKPVEPKLRCVQCGKPSVQVDFFLGWTTSDGFHINWPACKCGKFVVCPDCVLQGKEPDMCPTCGCSEFLT